MKALLKYNGNNFKFIATMLQNIVDNFFKQKNIEIFA